MNRRDLLRGTFAAGIAFVAPQVGAAPAASKADDTEHVLKVLNWAFKSATGSPPESVEVLLEYRTFKWAPVEKLVKGYGANGVFIRIRCTSCNIDWSGVKDIPAPRTGLGFEKDVERDY